MLEVYYLGVLFPLLQQLGQDRAANEFTEALRTVIRCINDPVKYYEKVMNETHIKVDLSCYSCACFNVFLKEIFTKELKSFLPFLDVE